MSEPVIFLSSESISKSQLDNLIVSLGGTRDVSPGISSLFSETGRIWVSISQTELDDMIPFLKDKASSRLGNPVKTLIVAEVSRKSGSAELVKMFVRKLSENNPIIVYDGHGNILSVTDFIAA